MAKFYAVMLSKLLYCSGAGKKNKNIVPFIHKHIHTSPSVALNGLHLAKVSLKSTWRCTRPWLKGGVGGGTWCGPDTAMGY